MRRINGNLPDLSFERVVWKRGFKFVAGVDEVGRGAFAGPVVAAAVAFATQIENSEFSIDDSKQMKPQEREKAAEWIRKNSLAWGIGEVRPGVINRLGIWKATKMAFRRAVAQANLKLKNKQSLAFQAKNLKLDYLLIDAFYIPYVNGIRKKCQMPIVKGDQKSFSIAAASIIAKVYRDSLMRKLGGKHRVYGWGKNKGYGTREHREAIEQYGITRLHRREFVATWKGKLKANSEKVKAGGKNLKVLRSTL